MPQAIRRMLNRVSLVILGFAGGTVLIGVVSAQRPDPAPGVPLPIREQNLDATGWIMVHEQGTATVTGTVNVGNFPSSVAVSNFPATQNVNVTGGEVSTKPSPVTTGFSDSICAAAGEQTRVRLDFIADPILVTDLTIGNPLKHEIGFFLHTVIEMRGSSGTPSGRDVAWEHQDHDGTQASVHHAFTRPVPVNQLTLQCTNESTECCVTVDLVGFSSR